MKEEDFSPDASTKELSRITTVRSYSVKDLGYLEIRETTWGIDTGSLRRDGFIEITIDYDEIPF